MKMSVEEMRAFFSIPMRESDEEQIARSSFHEDHNASQKASSLYGKGGLQTRLRVALSGAEREAVKLVAQNRPLALREFDQIPMYDRDLLRQAKLIAPYLAGKTVAFVGDIDSASLMLGMLSLCGNPSPARMVLLDFDARVLAAARRMALRYGFSRLLETQLHNFFDPLPADLIGTCDWFYTNPPFGSNNQGASAQLFIGRGQELCKQEGASGCIIMPYDARRPWTLQTWLATQRFLANGGWGVREKVDGMHRYHLDDDPTLTSSMVLVDAIAGEGLDAAPYAGRRVPFNEIPLFYGRSVQPPYPHYVREDGSFDMDWSAAEGEYNT